MRTGNRIYFLFVIFNLIMTTCTATVKPAAEQPIPLLPNTGKQTAVLQSTTSTIYLPFLADRYPLITPFGVDGKGSLDRMGTAGVTWLRLNVQLHWSKIEATEGVYDWSQAADVESRLIDAAQNGLNVILVVSNSPKWARKYPDYTCGPILETKFASFGNFLNQVVKRYNQPPYNVNYFQIWNEPDAVLNAKFTSGGCWAENTDETFGGKYYGKMLAQVYPRIKAASPSAQLVMGSLMMLCDPRDPNPLNYCANTAPRKSASFFKGVVETAKNAFDIVMFNSGPSYIEGENPVWSEFNNWRWKRELGGLVNGKIDYLRMVMATYGIDKPIIHSEAYFLDRPTDPAKFELFETYKADYLVWAYANGWSRNLKAIIWYSIEGWKGSELIINGTQETKAYQALSAMLRITQKTQAISRVEDPTGYTRFTFHGVGEDVWLLTPTGKEYGTFYSITRPAKFKRALDMYGNELITTTTITFNHPIYLIVSP